MTRADTPTRPDGAAIRSEQTPVYAEVGGASQKRRPADEPTAASAAAWWDAPRNVWTPIGWKDHCFRFNVLYNGTVLAEPAPHWTPVRPSMKRWLGQSLQLDILPTADGAFLPLPTGPTKLRSLDGGIGTQGWNDAHATPVLWTDLRLAGGTVIRQEIFSIVTESDAKPTGIEPHYAWIRLSVQEIGDAAASPTRIGIRMSRVHCVHGEHHQGDDGVTIDLDPQLASFETPLTFVKHDQATHIINSAGLVRLVALADRGVEFDATSDSEHVYMLTLPLAAAVGEYVDLLVPMLAAPADAIATVAARGREDALRTADAFWSTEPAGTSRIVLPEQYLQRVIAQNLKFADVLTERDHVTGDLTFLSGSWCYDSLSGTPTSMISHMFLDLLGRHETVDQHMELFRVHQGANKPPGPAYAHHDGYFATPKTLTPFDWLTDHGAVLHQASMHALLSGEADFIARWTDPIVRACDFICDACAQNNHDAVVGLLPPAVATDDSAPTQAVWTQAWHYKGLSSAVRFLTRIGHPRAEAIAAFAQRFKAVFVAAFRERAKLETWTDSQGVAHPKAPTTLSPQRLPFHIYNDALYLDTGPLVLVWAGLMDADDVLMRSARAFFGPTGPNARDRSDARHPLDPPMLEHGISTCEPCYSWNAYHAWQLGERNAYLEAMYAIYTGALSPQTYISGEHRHGVYGNLFAIPLAFHLTRLSVIDDEIAAGELHLLRLCPVAWALSERAAIFERMPTVYGPVDLRFSLSPDGRTLDVSFKADWRETPSRITLHVPPLRTLRRVRINGIESAIEGRRQIEL